MIQFPFIVCKRCNLYYEVHSPDKPVELGTCDCGNTFEYYESMDDLPDKDSNSIVPSKVEIIDDLIVSYESVTARIILYCVDELPFPVSETNLIKVLRGSNARFIRDNNLSNLTSYRILVNFSLKRLKRFIRTLKKERFLESRTYSYYSKLILSPRGRKFIYSDDTIVTGYFDEVHGKVKVSENNNDDIVYQLKHSTRSEKRAHAAYLMGESRDPAYIPHLCEAVHDANGNVRRLSASALGKIKNPNGLDALISLLDDDKHQVRQYAAKSLGMIGDVRALPYLLKTSQDPVYYVKDSAQNAIKKIREKLTSKI